jgi:hypothetical protein
MPQASAASATLPPRPSSRKKVRRHWDGVVAVGISMTLGMIAGVLRQRSRYVPDKRCAVKRFVPLWLMRSEPALSIARSMKREFPHLRW